MHEEHNQPARQERPQPPYGTVPVQFRRRRDRFFDSPEDIARLLYPFIFPPYPYYSYPYYPPTYYPYPYYPPYPYPYPYRRYRPVHGEAADMTAYDHYE